MLILKFNTLSADDLFAIERCLLRWLDDKARPSIDPDFNVLDYGRTELYGHLLGVFAKLGVLSALDITPSTLLDFLIDVDTTYLNAPYHSFYHAVDIVTVLYYILTELEADQYLSNLDIAALLIAALCHDAGHPGYNNLYQVNVKTELAARYNNTSVLEAYSATITRDLLHKHKLLKDLASTNGKSVTHHYTWTEGRFLDAIESLILATDMVYHFDLQEQAGVLEELLSQDDDEDDDSDWCSASDSDSFAIPTPSSSTYDEEDLCYSLNRDQRQSLCRILLHAADISNTVRPWAISKQWSDLIVQEFFRQGDAEKETGLDVSPGMDRDQSTQPDISLKFGDFLVKPYFEALAGFLPSANIFLDTLNENRSEWVRLKTCPEAAFPPENAANNERQFPSSLLPPQPVLNPSGRRISVAAGTVVIPDRQIFVARKRQRSTMSINTRSSSSGGGPNNLLQRRPAGLRSASHTGVPRIIVPDRRPSDLLQQQAWLSPTLLKTTTVLESPVSMCHPQDRSPLSRVSKRLA